MAAIVHGDIDGADVNSTTLSLTLSIGANGGNDTLVVGACGRNSSSPGPDITDITIDGVSVTLDAVSPVGDFNGVAIGSLPRDDLPDPDQTDVDIVVTYDATLNRSAGAAIAVIDGPVTVHDTAAPARQNIGGGASITFELDVDVAAGGVVFGIAAVINTSNPVDAQWEWTEGLTEAGDIRCGTDAMRFSDAILSNGTLETGRQITALNDDEGTGYFDGAAASVSYAPVAAVSEPASRRMVQGRGGITGGMMAHHQMRKRPSGLYMPERYLIVPAHYRKAA